MSTSATRSQNPPSAGIEKFLNRKFLNFIVSQKLAEEGVWIRVKRRSRPHSSRLKSEEDLCKIGDSVQNMEKRQEGE